MLEGRLDESICGVLPVEVKMEIEKVLQGDSWLGHPVHPAMISIPIGFWLFGSIMDGIAAVTGSECAQEAADYAIIGGVVGAGIAAATGVGEFLRVPQGNTAQRDAVTHGALNAAATAIFGVSASLRTGQHGRGKSTGILPKLLSLAGVGVIIYTGWLGGKLAYSYGVGVQKEHIEEEDKQPLSQDIKEEQMPRAHA